MRWVFVRHGESVANAQTRLAGHQDVDLTPRGEAQARALREVLADLSPDRVSCSDLLRARRTCALALDGRGLPVTHTPALRERTIGDWEGRLRAELVAEGAMELLVSFDRRPPGGESQADLARRALAWMATQPHREVHLVFAHAGLIRVVVGLLDGVPREAIGLRRVANAEQIAREVEPDHLQRLLDTLGDGPEAR